MLLCLLQCLVLLICFYCVLCYLKDADLLPHYKYFVEGIQPGLHSLKINSYHLPPSPWLKDFLLPALKVASSVTVLELSNCGLSSDDMAVLAKYLEQDTVLCSLNISGNNMGSVGIVKAFSRALRKHTLRHISCANCSFGGAENCGALARFLYACKRKESLEIGHSDFSAECVATVVSFLSKKISLDSFSLVCTLYSCIIFYFVLTRNSMLISHAPSTLQVGALVNKENKKLLVECVTKNNSIHKLRLHSNGLQPTGIFGGSKKAVESMSTLTHLDLSFNSLPVQAAKALSKFLLSNKTLTSLGLAKNNLTTKGARVLLSALDGDTANTTLQSLDLSRNWINGEVASVVIDLLRHNSTLLTLDLSGNKSLNSEQPPDHLRGGSWWVRRWNDELNRRAWGRWQFDDSRFRHVWVWADPPLGTESAISQIVKR